MDISTQKREQVKTIVREVTPEQAREFATMYAQHRDLPLHRAAHHIADTFANLEDFKTAQVYADLAHAEWPHKKPVKQTTTEVLERQIREHL